MAAQLDVPGLHRVSPPPVPIGLACSIESNSSFRWGYFQTGSGVPAGQKPLISRLVDLDYSSIPCREAFNITTPPDVDRINKHGGFNITYPRLAIVDGEADPWRAATPHRIGLDERKSTTSEPFLLIGGGAVHHWDENGVKESSSKVLRDGALPPREVKRVQDEEIRFVQAWVDEWRAQKGDYTAMPTTWSDDL